MVHIVYVLKARLKVGNKTHKSTWWAISQVDQIGRALWRSTNFNYLQFGAKWNSFQMDEPFNCLEWSWMILSNIACIVINDLYSLSRIKNPYMLTRITCNCLSSYFFRSIVHFLVPALSSPLTCNKTIRSLPKRGHVSPTSVQLWIATHKYETDDLKNRWVWTFTDQISVFLEMLWRACQCIQPTYICWSGWHSNHPHQLPKYNGNEQ